MKKETIKDVILKLRIELHKKTLNDDYISNLCYQLKRIVPDKSKAPKDKRNTEVYSFFQPFEAKEAREYIIKACDIFKKRFNRDAFTFLDVGAGVGHICELANKLLLETTGIELSSGLLRYAKQLSPNTNFIKADILKYNKYDGYDIIWLFNPCNGGELDIMLKQIQNPCIIIYLNSYLRALPKEWTKFNLGKYEWDGKAIKNF